MRQSSALVAALFTTSYTWSLPVNSAASNYIDNNPATDLSLGLNTPVRPALLPPIQLQTDASVLSALQQIEMANPVRRPILAGAKLAKRPERKRVLNQNDHPDSALLQFRLGGPAAFHQKVAAPRSSKYADPKRQLSIGQREQQDNDAELDRWSDLRARRKILNIGPTETIPQFAYGQTVKQLRTDPRVDQWLHLMQEIKEGKLKWGDLKGDFYVRPPTTHKRRRRHEGDSVDQSYSLLNQVKEQKIRGPSTELYLDVNSHGKGKGKMVMDRQQNLPQPEVSLLSQVKKAKFDFMQPSTAGKHLTLGQPGV